MKQDQTEEFRLVLESKKEELLREIGQGRERFQIDAASDPLDHAENILIRDTAAEEVERKTAILHEVERALTEIGAGTFGTCSECGKGIPAKRLEALPWSPHCVHCQERAESTVVTPPAALAR